MSKLARRVWRKQDSSSFFIAVPWTHLHLFDRGAESTAEKMVKIDTHQTPNHNPLMSEDLNAEIARLKAENEALKNKAA